MITAVYGSGSWIIESHDDRHVLLLLPYNEDGTTDDDLNLDTAEARSLAAALLAAADASEATP